MTWSEAKTYCEMLDGHLVTITSQEEQDFIKQLIKDGTMASYWLGGKRSDNTRNEWEWITGEQWNYTSWDSGQPDGSGDRLQIFNRDRQGQVIGLWDNTYADGDHGGGIKYPSIGFICEWDDLNTNISDNIINNSLILKIGSPKALVNGKVEQIDETNASVVPFVDGNGRTLVPVRFIAESFGYKVDFDAKNNKISILDSLRIQMVLHLNKTFIEIDNEKFDIDSAPIITSDGRTVIPLRAFIEIGLKKKIAYIASERIIIISDFDIASKVAEEVAKKFTIPSNTKVIGDNLVNVWIDYYRSKDWGTAEIGVRVYAGEHGNYKNQPTGYDANFFVYNNKELKAVFTKCSTLPDASKSMNGNQGQYPAVVKDGEYSLEFGGPDRGSTENSRGTGPFYKIYGTGNSKDVPCLRWNGNEYVSDVSTVGNIELHYSGDNKSSTNHWSTGCLNIYKENQKFYEYVGKNSAVIKIVRDSPIN